LIAGRDAVESVAAIEGFLETSMRDAMTTVIFESHNMETK